MFPDWPLDASIETIVTLDDVGGGTKVTVAHRVLPPDAACHPAAKRWSPMAREGAMQVFDRLGEHLSMATTRKWGRDGARGAVLTHCGNGQLLQASGDSSGDPAPASGRVKQAQFAEVNGARVPIA